MNAVIFIILLINEGGKGFFREPRIANICCCEMRFDEFLCREM